MAKDKSVKRESHLPKRKKLGSNESAISGEEIMENKLKMKRKHVEVEEHPKTILPVTTTTRDKTLKKDKKRKKKPAESKQQLKQTEIPDPSSYPKMTHDPKGGGDQEEELGPEEKRVLERKMKKILKKEEKKRLKVEGKPEATGPTAPQHALDYLRCWAENRLMWKFQKTRQTWLLQHMFDTEKVPDENFFVLLKYLEGLQGSAKDTTVQKALTLVEESGQAPEDTVVQQRAHRAREVIQLFS